jgi:hypothetical protein
MKLLQHYTPCFIEVFRDIFPFGKKLVIVPLILPIEAGAQVERSYFIYALWKEPKGVGIRAMNPLLILKNQTV